MAAYLFANVKVKDPERFDDYRKLVSPLIEKCGGRYLVRGGEQEVVEGDPGFARVVILEFPDMEMLKAFYYGEEYQEVLKIRLESADTDAVLIEGYAG
jgi:uncharacterized protein (DUF1330 family)